jgi:hypothetical protein
MIWRNKSESHFLKEGLLRDADVGMLNCDGF